MPSSVEKRLKEAEEARKALRAKASKGFLLRGTRKLRNNSVLVPKKHSKAEVAIPAGRRPKPVADYLASPRRVASLGSRETHNEEGRELAPVFPDAAAMVKPDMTREALKLRRAFFIPVEQRGLEGWLVRQEKYIESLSLRDLEILKSYTSHGDRLVNGYCRGSLDDIGDLITAMVGEENVPLAYSFYDQYREYSKKGLALEPRKEYVDEEGEINMPTFKTTLMRNLDFFRKAKNIGTLLEQYKQDLVRIISNSPKLTSPIVTYRGIQSEAHLSSSKFKNVDFLSTTLDPFSVLPFTQEFKDPSGKTGATFNCCVYEMTINKTVPCMYMQFISNYANEFEVLVPPGMEVSLGKEVRVKVKPASRAEEKAALLEGISTENVLVVLADVRKPVKPVAVAGISLAKRAGKFGTRKR